MKKQYRRSFGKTADITYHTGMSTEDIVRTYNAREMSEEDFKWMEDNILIPIWPFFVRKNLSVRTHVFLVVLGLILYCLVQRDLGKDSMYLPTFAFYLYEIKVALVSEGKRKLRFIVEEMDVEVARLFSKLDRSRYMPS